MATLTAPTAHTTLAVAQKMAWDELLKRAFEVYAEPSDENMNALMQSMWAYRRVKLYDSRVQNNKSAPTPVVAVPAPDPVNENDLRDPSEVDSFSQIYMHLTTTRELDLDDLLNVSGCLGYALREHLRGEDLGDPVIVQSYSSPLHHEVVVRYDYNSSTSERTDPASHIVDAFETAKRYIFEGTPVRKTDKAGYGTRGTRLVEGLGSMSNNDSKLVNFLVC